MIKADDKAILQDENDKDVLLSVSNFELLKKQVDILTEMINNLTETLNQNNIYMKSENQVFNPEDLYNELIKLE